MAKEKYVKANRILNIYSKLIQGGIVNKKKAAELFNVSQKTIQRDLEDIRAYFYDNREREGNKDIKYNYYKNGYFLSNGGDILTEKDTLAIIKILLESRAFCKEELDHLANSILKQIDIEQRKYVKKIVGNELLNYTSLKHNSKLLSKIWDLSELIRSKKIIQIVYIKSDGIELQLEIKPVLLIFSEFYFYLIAYFHEFKSPNIFRVDRIKAYKSTGERFYIPQLRSPEYEGLRKKVQFTYPGEFMKIKFEFNGDSLEDVMDRLPTAKVIDKYDNKYLIEAEVFGKGVIMWILSQGRKIKVVSPIELVEDINTEINKIEESYKPNL